jgi:hypothetical protein
MEKVSPWGFIGIGALACLLFLDLASLRFAPWWTVVVLGVIWLLLFARACRWFTTAPQRVAWVALGGFVAWAVVVIGGGLLLW